MPRHRKRTLCQELARLRRELRGAEAAGVDVARVRANLKKVPAQILKECDDELLAATQDPAVRVARRER